MAEMKGLLTLGLVGVGGYLLYEWYVQQQAAAAAATATSPGTTPGTPAPAPAATMQTVASDMQNVMGGATTLNADQWNVAFVQVMGQPIDQKYGFSFDAAYGPVVNRVRNYGATMSALTFLQLAASVAPQGLPGLSGIARYSVPALTTTGNMLYRAHHPYPYARTFNLRGLSGPVHATGFEKVMWAGYPLRSNRLRGY